MAELPCDVTSHWEGQLHRPPFGEVNTLNITHLYFLTGIVSINHLCLECIYPSLPVKGDRGHSECQVRGKHPGAVRSSRHESQFFSDCTHVPPSDFRTIPFPVVVCFSSGLKRSAGWGMNGPAVFNGPMQGFPLATSKCTFLPQLFRFLCSQKPGESGSNSLQTLSQV